MCSISGLYITDDKLATKEQMDKVHGIIKKAENRGRDSFGVAYFSPEGSRSVLKRRGKVQDHLDSLKFREDVKIVINNNRAEPTTEYVERKEDNDIQPFFSSDWRVCVAHNGTIANDKELKEKHKLSVNTKIDTAVLTEYLGMEWDGSFEALQKILRDKVVGSYALAIYDQKSPDTLYLAVNYKPLYLECQDNAIYFTSLETYLEKNASIQSSYDRKSKIISVKPYTLLKIQGSKIEEVSLWKKQDKKRVLAICSGGLDSTVVANHYIKQGMDVTLLHFQYKCRAEDSEVKAINNISKKLGCEALFVETDIFKEVIKHSRLTETKEDLVKDGGGEASAELAHEWVPARNLIMLSLATGIAEGHKYDIIALGNNLEESGAYPDNEMAFIQRFSDVLPFSTNLQNRVRVEMPVGNLMKHEIVKMGLEEDAPLELAWSCYESGDIHCGSCGPCFMRKNGFKMNGIEDIINYKQ